MYEQYNINTYCGMTGIMDNGHCDEISCDNHKCLQFLQLEPTLIHKHTIHQEIKIWSHGYF